MPQFSIKSEKNAVRWGVVLTANEPLALVECNVRWHLTTGAAAVFVFLDDPSDDAAHALGNIPGCTVQICNDAYWAARRPRKGRPPSQMRRQTINANRAQNRCGLDWLFHIDADEFIWQDDDLSAELGAHDDPQVELNLPVLERVFPDGPQRLLFEGRFRATSILSEQVAQDAFGPFATFMKRGQYSHGAGKSGVRVGAGLRLGVHNATRTGSEGRQRRAGKRVSSTARLLHFDGLTPLHWASKMLRYSRTPPEVQAHILQPHRAQQLTWLRERCDTLEQVERAHHELFALTPQRLAGLTEFGLLRDIPFEPALVECACGCIISPALFDKHVLRRAPWLVAMLDL